MPTGKTKPLLWQTILNFFFLKEARKAVSCSTNWTHFFSIGPEMLPTDISVQLPTEWTTLKPSSL